ncbi:hypothetical protein GCK32_018510 [Trichostrongylus colubriformis]|uniref:Uncharacterized protein n=1 Tax=Trichostrongylus colubriformis TaxID=6319 RepID=A0AAN8IB45_TRICO
MRPIVLTLLLLLFVTLGDSFNWKKMCHKAIAQTLRGAFEVGDGVKALVEKCKKKKMLKKKNPYDVVPNKS